MTYEIIVRKGRFFASRAVTEKMLKQAFNPEYVIGAETRRLFAEVDAMSEKEVRDGLLEDLDAKKKKKEALKALGVCTECEGTGEFGGQFTGGEQTCHFCDGTGDYRDETKQVKG